MPFNFYLKHLVSTFSQCSSHLLCGIERNHFTAKNPFDGFFLNRAVLCNFWTRHRFELFCFWFQDGALVNSCIAVLKKSNDRVTVLPRNGTNRLFRKIWVALDSLEIFFFLQTGVLFVAVCVIVTFQTNRGSHPRTV